jgi:hypothetical protein
MWVVADQQGAESVADGDVVARCEEVDLRWGAWRRWTVVSPRNEPTDAPVPRVRGVVCQSCAENLRRFNKVLHLMVVEHDEGALEALRKKE